VGGGIDFGETPEQEVIREAKEEAGIDIVNPRLFFHRSKVDTKKNKQFIALIFWAKVLKPQVVLNTPTPTPTSTLSPTPVVTQPRFPIVQTNSTYAPYISTVVVNGTVNPNGAATTYWYEYGQISGLGSKTSNYLIGSGYATLYTPAYITGLAPNTNYYFRLSAQNAFGTVNGATYSFKTNNTPAPVGVAPTASTNSATNITRTSAHLNGQINPKNAVTTFWFEYGVTSNLGSVTTFQTSANNNVSAAAVASVSGLQPFVKYYFRLDAQNQFGTVNSQIQNFTTNGPAAATIPTVNTNSVSAITSSSAKLNGRVNPNGIETTVTFEYSKTSLLFVGGLVLSSPQQVLSTEASSINVSANINNLTNNTKYYVRLVATSTIGKFTGDMVSFTTKK
jgi:ADP-ribose pyrophosphatase YjhB (NUDIX family)/phosphodiesterase/alkaline phosphatase D-like protein